MINKDIRSLYELAVQAHFNINCRRIVQAFVIATLFASSTVFANKLSEECIEEFARLPKTQKDFDVEEFLKELPAEVLKAKAQFKLPFGKPSPSKKSSIGITMGCLNQFPESAGAMTSMLKEVSIAMAKDMVKGSTKGMAKEIATNRLDATDRGEGKSRSQNSAEKKAADDKDAIYMRDGQEIKNIIISEIGLEEVKYKVSTRATLYVVKKSEVSSISYSDGDKEFYCNGTIYRSTTHFCHTDGKTYSCGNKPYNPATQSCNNSNQIFNKCGKNEYNPLTHFCHTDDKAYSCNNEPYNPATQVCHNNDRILEKCGKNGFDPVTHFCHTDNKTYSCGNKPYNPVTQFCHTNGKAYSCDDKPYNPATHFCDAYGRTFSCNNKPYDPSIRECKSQTYSCDDEPYDPATHFCHTDGQTYSCDDEPYNPATHNCRDGKIRKKK